MKAIILCAGKGTRMRPLTNTIPKPLLLIKGKELLLHILESLPDEITEVFLVTSYLQKQIENFVLTKCNFQFKIQCVEQIPEKKGTFAALLSVRNFLNDNERFLILNGDDLISKDDLKKVITFKRCFTVQKAIMPRYYKVVQDSNGMLSSFEVQDEHEKESGTLIATGTYVLDTGIFNYEPRLLTGNEIGIPQTIMDNKDTYPISVLEINSWIPVNSLDDFNFLNKI